MASAAEELAHLRLEVHGLQVEVRVTLHTPWRRVPCAPGAALQAAQPHESSGGMRGGGRTGMAAGGGLE